MFYEEPMKIVAFIFTIVFFSFGSHAHVDSIDKSWFKEQVSIEQYHDERFKHCLLMYNFKKKRLDEEKSNLREEYGDSFEVEYEKRLKKRYEMLLTPCIKGKGNPFNHDLLSGYRIYKYDSPKAYWQQLRGSRGYVLVNKDDIVEVIQTMVN